MEETLPKVRVGGVPEHFNYPWHMAIEQKIFTKHGVEVEWVEQKLGTGAMITAAKSGEVDLIIALTEGLVADITGGSDLRLLGTYVKSPLCWAISTGRESAFHSVEDLKNQKFGISRFTSGSHLMVCVLAIERGWHPQNDVQFLVKGDFQSLRASVNDGSTAAFLWETFTTKPFHDSGEIRRIGEITTPWPCFMIAARKSVAEEKLEAIKKVFAGIQEACHLFRQDTVGMPAVIAERYSLKPDDAKQWYDGVDIAGTKVVSEGALQRAVNVLYQSKVISTTNVTVNNFILPGLTEIEKDIHAMKLYNKPELVRGLYNLLKAAGLSSGPLSEEQLIPYDQTHHYHGVDALELCIEKTGIKSTSRVINIGSGLGGPARYLGWKVGCQVLAVELQDELHRTASELTERTDLRNKVHHMAGDFLQIAQHLKTGDYDAIVSWLTVLHIPDRKTLFELSFELLKPGGIFFAEDFFELGHLTETEKETLKRDVFCSYLPDMETYKTQLRSAGFEILEAEDVTKDWMEYTRQRVQRFEEQREQLIKVHRADTYNRLHYFYNVIKELYAAGNLGGGRFIARKPLKE